MRSFSLCIISALFVSSCLIRSANDDKQESKTLVEAGKKKFTSNLNNWSDCAKVLNLNKKYVYDKHVVAQKYSFSKRCSIYVGFYSEYQRQEMNEGIAFDEKSDKYHDKNVGSFQDTIELMQNTGITCKKDILNFTLADNLKLVFPSGSHKDYKNIVIDCNLMKISRTIHIGLSAKDTSKLSITITKAPNDIRANAYVDKNIKKIYDAFDTDEDGFITKHTQVQVFDHGRDRKEILKNFKPH